MILHRVLFVLALFLGTRSFASSWKTIDCSDALGQLRVSETYRVGGSSPENGDAVGVQIWTYMGTVIGERRFIEGAPDEIPVPLEVQFLESTRVSLEETQSEPSGQELKVFAIQVVLQKADQSPLHPHLGAGPLRSHLICSSFFPGAIP